VVREGLTFTLALSATQEDPIPAIWAALRGNPSDKSEEEADIAIQSNAPPFEAADNGHRRINSGLYLVRAGPRYRKIGKDKGTQKGGRREKETADCGDKKARN
jgi:hypothetical protein